jgi:alkylhydroperoxidase family enzyme
LRFGDIAGQPVTDAWVGSKQLPATIALLQRLQPDAWSALGPVLAHAWTMADPELLALALTRMVQLNGTTAIAAEVLPPAASPRDEEARRTVSGWPSSPLFSPMERACLGFVEQMQVDPDAMTAAQVDELRAHMTAGEVLGFASAIYVLDAHLRVLAVMTQLVYEPRTAS